MTPGRRAKRAVAFSTLFLFSLPLKSSELAVQLDFNNACQLPVISVEVESKKGQFLLDTGATTTVVDNDLVGIPVTSVDKARLRVGESGLYGLGGVTFLDKLRIGDYKEKHLPVRVLDLSPLSEKCGKKFDGILGNDILRHFKQVTIDFEKKEVKLTR